MLRADCFSDYDDMVYGSDDGLTRGQRRRVVLIRSRGDGTAMKVTKLSLGDFRLFNNAEIYIGGKVTAIAGNNGTGKSTVLGILANSSQLKGKKTLLGKPYRGEFSELFSADKEYDPAGQKVHIWYEEKGVELEADFRTGWQKKKGREGSDSTEERFRVIPKRKRLDGTSTESKIESPVIYLGLSRLYPVGETVDAVTAKSRRWGDAADEKWFNDNYSRILSIHEPIRSLSSLSISGISSKNGTGVKTDTYGPMANSSGQDNLGQILLAILSLKKLRDEMGDDWDGGLLLIDEVDASLHPAAQQRLVKLLLDESRECGFQVVFTTHSTVILRELSEKNQFNPVSSPGGVEVAYLSCANGKLTSMRNPSWSTLENGLYVTNSALSRRPVSVFSEDAEARWFMREILSAARPDVIDKIDFLDISLGCDEIKKLYAGDFSYFREKVVVFDGDVSDASIEEKIPPALRRNGGNIVRLPGGKRPENVVWDYLKGNPADRSELWSDLERVGIDWTSIVENPPENLCQNRDERVAYKDWLNKYLSYFDRAHVLKHWVDDNRSEADGFVRDFMKAYNTVAKRIGAQILPISKRADNR